MAGRLIPIVGKQTFSLNFASTNSIAILGNRFYDVSDAVQGVVVARVSSVSVPSGNFSLYVYSVAAMPDDPATLYTQANESVLVQLFASSYPAAILGSWTAATAAPYSVGPMISFQLQSAWGGAGGLGTITLAVDLLIRDRRQSFFQVPGLGLPPFMVPNGMSGPPARATGLAATLDQTVPTMPPGLVVPGQRVESVPSDLATSSPLIPAIAAAEPPTPLSS